MTKMWSNLCCAHVRKTYDAVHIIVTSTNVVKYHNCPHRCSIIVFRTCIRACVQEVLPSYNLESTIDWCPIGIATKASGVDVGYQSISHYKLQIAIGDQQW
jgi:hypothetical protein